MERRVTIKDIALAAGVSIGTVHCALNGKSGVSEATRVRVNAIAGELGYRPNSVAASLKRKKLRIAASFPAPELESRYYYSFVWEGLRDYIETLRDFNVELIETPFHIGAPSHNGADEQAEGLARLMESDEPDGILTTGCMNNRCRLLLRDAASRGIPSVLAGIDDETCGRLCCVQPNHIIIGRTTAELICRQIPRHGGIFLLAGEVNNPSHYEVVQGFDDYMRMNGLENPVYKIHVRNNSAELYKRVVDELRIRGDISACCAVNARGSVMLGNALNESGLAGKVVAVGSDLFEETMNWLKDGTFTNLFFKKPYSQAYSAAKYLADYLIKGITPSKEMIYVGNEVIFQSSIPMYDNGLYRMIR